MLSIQATLSDDSDGSQADALQAKSKRETDIAPGGSDFGVDDASNPKRYLVRSKPICTTDAFDILVKT